MEGKEQDRIEWKGREGDVEASVDQLRLIHCMNGGMNE